MTGLMLAAGSRWFDMRTQRKLPDASCILLMYMPGLTGFSGMHASISCMSSVLLASQRGRQLLCFLEVCSI